MDDSRESRLQFCCGAGGELVGQDARGSKLVIGIKTDRDEEVWRAFTCSMGPLCATLLREY